MHPRFAFHRPSSLARRGSEAAAMAFCAAALLALGPREARAQVCVPEDCLPPANSAYDTPLTYHFSFLGPTVDLGNLKLHNFTSCSSPPASVPNATTVSSFDAVMDYSESLNGGPAVVGQASAHATIRVSFNHQTGSIRYFDTEMLQLDLSGIVQPVATLVRESPTLASLGQTTIETLGGGNFKIDSFFDVFFEMSIDGGVTWAPGSNGPGHLTVTGPGCPTPSRQSTWGRVKITYR